MATLHDEILIEALEENFADDPYSTATYAIRNILSRALSDHMNDRMSDQEFQNLSRIAMTVVGVLGGETIEPRAG